MIKAILCQGKKIIMIFDTWIVLWRLEGKRIRLTAESRRVIKAVESSSSRFCRPQQLMVQINAR